MGMEKRRYLGPWEFGCLVFHACFYRMFTTHPQWFHRIGGTAGWLTALWSGLVFLGLFFLLLWLSTMGREKISPPLKKVGNGFLAFYWICSACNTLREFVYVLGEVAYPQSPSWFLGGFLLIGAVVCVLCGGKAVYRMHSLAVLGVGASMALVGILGMKYGDVVYLTPWLGKGAKQVFGTGLSTLFFYTDSLLVLSLAPKCKKKATVLGSGMTAAVLAVALNIFLVLISSLSHSSELQGVSANLIYPLTKTAYFGQLWSRMDAIYLVALTTSGFLAISMALHLFFYSLQKLGMNRVPGKKMGALCLVGLLCLPLAGCYDSREVEAGAYTIALGIDVGEEKPFRYTFQLSNPLELGGSMETVSKDSSSGEEEDTEENKTVSNITVEEENFYLALNHLKSHLSKEPDFSHLKVLVFSVDAAKKGVLEHASLLFREQEIRPGTEVCLAESAEDFLKQVKPTLEQSTARYYELLFRNQSAPYAPVMELREFVSRGTDGGWDPILPVATKEKLHGIGIFRQGKLVAVMDEKAALLYGLLSGNAENIAVQAGKSSFSVSSKNPPDFSVNDSGVEVETTLSCELLTGSEKDREILRNDLEKEMTALLRDTKTKGSDVAGVGAWLRCGMMEEEEWKKLKWEKTWKKVEVFSKIKIK